MIRAVSSWMSLILNRYEIELCPCPLNGIFIRLRLVLLRKLVLAPLWPLRGSQPTSEQKVWLSSIFSQTDIGKLIYRYHPGGVARMVCTFIPSFKSHISILRISERSRNDQKNRGRSYHPCHGQSANWSFCRSSGNCSVQDQ